MIELAIYHIPEPNCYNGKRYHAHHCDGMYDDPVNVLGAVQEAMNDPEVGNIEIRRVK